MARAILPVRIARNDGEWTLYRHSDHLFRVRMDDHGTAAAGIPLKAGAIQPLPRSRPFQLGQSRIGSVLIDVLDGGGLNLRHAGVIGIRLCGHVLSSSTRSGDQLEQRRRFGKADTIDVHDMQRCVRFGGKREHFFQTRDAGTNVYVDWRFRFGGDAEHRQQLIARCRRRVRKPGADVDRARAETKLDALRDFANLRGRRRAIGAVAHRHPSAGVVHHRHPNLDVADADAVVDYLTGAALVVPGSDIGRAELELERGRHTVQRIEPIGLRALSVRVQIDEARGDDQAPCIDRVTAPDGARRDDGDASAREPDIADRIESGGWIHHVAAEDHVIVDGRPA